MTAKQKRLKQLFFKAIGIELIDRRREFIDEACRGDEEMRTRLELLLEAHSRDETLLDRTAWKSIGEPSDDP